MSTNREHVVGNAIGADVANRDRDRGVEPPISLVARLENGRGTEVQLAWLKRAGDRAGYDLRADGGDNAAIVAEDQGIIVGLDCDAGVESQRLFAVDQRPIATPGQYLSVESRPFDPTSSNTGDHSKSGWPGADGLLRLVDVGGV